MAMALLYKRYAQAGIKDTKWELVPPLLALVALSSTFISVAAMALSVAFLLNEMRSSTGEPSNTRDSLVAQLPSIALAPAVMIALRDNLDTGARIDRADLEAAALVISGLGASTWTALVLRAQGRLMAISHCLLAASVLFAATLTTVSESHWLPLGALMAIELARGSSWLAVTSVITNARASRGAAFNLIATGFTIAPVALGGVLQLGAAGVALAYAFASAGVLALKLIPVWTKT
jgi:hypothetical protein